MHNKNIIFFAILAEMASQMPEKVHIRHFMVLKFHKGSNATIVTKCICDVYTSGDYVRKCQRWYANFISGHFHFSDSYRSGRRKTLNHDVYAWKWEQIVSDNRGTIKHW